MQSTNILHKTCFTGTNVLRQSVRPSVRAFKCGVLAMAPQGQPEGGSIKRAMEVGAEKLGNKLIGEKQQPSIKHNSSVLTTNAGTPVYNNDFSLTAGARGPVLLEDYHFLEKMGQFNREKIPERVVHARGMGAKGYFEVTNDVSQFTCADFLSSVGKKTSLVARLSTVTHEKGSPESLRDVRGFSVKFYTDDGNWDFVGNNIPVFFIRDGMKFPDLVHALRPNPKNHIQEGWRILDFLAHHPESTHMLTWLLADEGLPANWRSLEGYGVNTFLLINDKGEERYVKFHWRPKDGAQFLDDEEAPMVGEKNMRHSHATHDLYNAIEHGNYPEWEFSFQVMDIEDEDKLDFDPLDCTKVWPEDKYPLIPVGKMVLNENVTNFFNEVEVLAVAPGRTVPGIGISNDKVLQTRVHAYADTQNYRLGVNYQLLYINAPRCPFHNNHNDGFMNVTEKDEEVNYWPSMVEKTDEGVSTKFTESKQMISGQRVKVDYPERAMDDFKQAGDRIRGFTPAQKEKFTKNLVGWMVDPKCTKQIQDVWFGYWSKADASFGEELKQKVQEKMGMSNGAGHPSKEGATVA